MFVTFCVLKLLKSKLERELQPTPEGGNLQQKIKTMPVTFCVLKLLKFKLVRELQPSNIIDGVTFWY